MKKATTNIQSNSCTSFQEYLLEEYYIESILYNKGFRLNIGQPTEISIEFISSLLSVIKDANKKEYEKSLLQILKSLFIQS